MNKKIEFCGIEVFRTQIDKTLTSYIDYRLEGDPPGTFRVLMRRGGRLERESITFDDEDTPVEHYSWTTEEGFNHERAEYLRERLAEEHT